MPCHKDPRRRGGRAWRPSKPHEVGGEGGGWGGEREDDDDEGEMKGKRTDEEDI